MKKIVALVLSLVMVLGLATTAFAAKAGSSFATAKNDAGWDYVIEVDDAEDAKDQTFATYEIEAVAKKDGAVAWWDTSLVVEEDDDFDLGTFVKIGNTEFADFVLIDGKTVSYYVSIDTNVDDWDAKAVKVTLPATPVDNADKACNTLYSGVEGVPATLYFYDDTLWVAATVDENVWTNCFNVDGAAVLVREAEEGVDYEYTGHDYQLLYKGDHDTGAVTKVYCQDCMKEFKFVEAPETVAVATFGAGNYMPVVVDGDVVPMLFMELVTPAVPGVSAATDGSAAADGEKVESAETFDAGIAMYVGMSVMAAAGSAVVLKKKD